MTIIVPDAGNAAGGRRTMDTNEQRKSYGWVWVWATLVVFVVFEMARLA